MSMFERQGVGTYANWRLASLLNSFVPHWQDDRTPLHLAARYAGKETVDALAAKADCNAKDQVCGACRGVCCVVVCGGPDESTS